MGKVAFVFPGQGAQYPGMGQSLCDVSPAAADVFRNVDRIRPGTSRQCFRGADAQLQQTSVTQPCLWAVEMAAAAALDEAGIRADVTAVFSLGELSAISYASVVDASTCFKLVCERGRLMQNASAGSDTAMAAVVNLSNEEVEAICARFDRMYPVNYNCPGQVTVAGPKESMGDFSVAAIKKEFGTVQILVNNVGITRDGLIALMKEDQFDDVISVNLKSAFNMIRHCTPLFIRNRGGRILNISSFTGIMGNAGQANYAASKAGLIGLTKSVARELAPKGITCNAVAPGFIDTDMTKGLHDSPLAASIPLGRMGKPEEVAQYE